MAMRRHNNNNNTLSLYFLQTRWHLAGHRHTHTGSKDARENATSY